MAKNEATMDSAEFTFCLEGSNKYRDETGFGRQTVRQLPWVFVRFNDVGEERKYVMPLPPQALMMGSGIHNDSLTDMTAPIEGGSVIHYKYGRAFLEWMPFKVWPLDNGGPANNGTPGPRGVHFFGGI